MNDLDCKQAGAWMDAAVDGELDLATQLAFDRHLAGCAKCQAAYQARREVVGRVRSSASRYVASRSLREQILAGLPPEEKAAPALRLGPVRRAWAPRVAWAGSLAALAASLVLYLAVPGQQDVLTRDLVAAHVRSLIPEHLIDVPSSDSHTVKPWFNGRAALSPPVPNLAEHGFQLVGGRLDYVDEHTAAVVVYRRNQHIINLFAWADPAASSLKVATRNGYNVLEWAAGGLRFSAVSDLNLAELELFQRLWVSAAATAEAGTPSSH